MARVATRASSPPTGWMLGIGLFGMGMIAMAVVNALPFLTGGLIQERGLTTSVVGGINSAELLSSAVISILLGLVRVRPSPRALGITGCAIFCLSALASLAHPVWALGSARAAAGIGEGLTLVAAAQAVAISTHPSFLSAITTTLAAAVGTGQALLIGQLIAKHGVEAGYIFLVVAGMVAGACGWALPTSFGHSSTASRVAAPNARFLSVALAFSAAMNVLGAGAVWSFSERIGLHVGLRPAAVALAIGLSGIVGVLGGAAAVMAARLRMDLSMAVLSSAVFAASVSWLTLTSGETEYFIALCTLSFLFVFGGPFFTGIAARLDPSGGAVALVGGTQLLAGGAAPLIGGLIVNDRPFTALFPVTAAAGVASIAGLACVAWSFARPAEGTVNRSQSTPS